MSAGEFKYLPGVTIQPGDTEQWVRAAWHRFREYNAELAALRFEYTQRTPWPGRHDRCTHSAAHPNNTANVQHFDESGRLTHTTTHPNLLAPSWFEDPRWAGLSLTRPGRIDAEFGVFA